MNHKEGQSNEEIWRQVWYGSETLVFVSKVPLEVQVWFPSIKVSCLRNLTLIPLQQRVNFITMNNGFVYGIRFSLEYLQGRCPMCVDIKLSQLSFQFQSPTIRSRIIGSCEEVPGNVQWLESTVQWSGGAVRVKISKQKSKVKTAV